LKPLALTSQQHDIKMKIGDFRKQVAIQAEQSTPDGAGGYALAWTTIATVWADIAPVSGREIYTAGHLEGHITHKVTLRWRADLSITSDMRLLYNSRSFNIQAVINQDETNQYVIVLATEGAAV